MYVCPNCQQPINSASAICPYCGAVQDESESAYLQTPRKPRSASKLVLAFAIVIAGIWVIIWFALPLRFENPRGVAEADAIQAVHSLHQQLATYEDGAGSFPRTLQSLGDPAREAAQLAMSGGYSIEYTPTRQDSDGKAHSYSLLALPRNYGYESLYTDPSGTIHETRDSRPATPEDQILK